MKKGKYQNGVCFHGGKALAAFLAVVLLIGATIGGTLAWLTDTTEEVENTFTVGNIEIDLTETTEDYKMIPGHTIEKDPVVTVKKDSEDCWVFVKVTRSGGDITVGEKTYSFDDFITYNIDSNNWTKQENAEGIEANEEVYYCYAKDVTADRPIKVLGYTNAKGEYINNKVMVKDTVTKEMMDEVQETGNNPKLTFTAYAVQYYSTNNTPFEVAEAWKQVFKPASN